MNRKKNFLRKTIQTVLLLHFQRMMSRHLAGFCRVSPVIIRYAVGLPNFLIRQQVVLRGMVTTVKIPTENHESDSKGPTVTAATTTTATAAAAAVKPLMAFVDSKVFFLFFFFFFQSEMTAAFVGTHPIVTSCAHGHLLQAPHVLADIADREV